MRKMRGRRDLEYYFCFDAITGIWNRYYFGIHDAEYRNEKRNYAVAVLYISLDGLREINEKRGFSKGDLYLKTFAEFLTAEFGKNSCYRMNGSEFVVLLEDVAEDDAKAELEAFEELLDSRQMSDVTVGYVWKAASESLENVVLLAEKAMYQNCL